MENLIGMQFRRNVYGLSLWTDVVEKVWVKWVASHPYDGTQKVEIMISGKSHICAFSLSEVVFIRPLDFGQKLEENKRQLHEIIQEEWVNKQKFKQK